MDTWSILQQYASNPSQLTWLEKEYLAHPPSHHQTPQQWLLWRTKVAEGMTEAAAWDWAMQEDPIYSSTQPDAQPSFPESTGYYGNVSLAGPSGTQALYPDLSVYHDIPYQSSYDFGHPTHSTGQQPSNEHAFVSLNEIAPLPNSLPNYLHESLDDGSQDADGERDELAEDVKPVIHDLRSPSPSPPLIRLQSADLATPLASPLDDLRPPHLSTDHAGPSRPARPLSLGRRTSPRIHLIPDTEKGYSSRRRNFMDNFNTSTFRRLPVDLDRKGQITDIKSESRPASSSAAQQVTMSTIRALIDADELREGNPAALWKLLRMRRIDGQPAPPRFEPNPQQAKEILAQLKNNAPNDYLRNMANNGKYVSVIRGWLEEMRKQPAKWEGAIAPLFQMLAKTDMPVNFLVHYRIGKLVKAVGARAQEQGLASNPDIQQAMNKFMSWCTNTLAPMNRTMPLPDDDVDNAPKKRKTEEDVKRPTSQVASASDQNGKLKRPASADPPKAPGQPPDKKPKPSSSSADMSFFSAPPPAPATTSSTNISSAYRPRAKVLPDIKKRDGPSTSTTHQYPPAPPAQPNPASSSLLANTLKALNKTESFRSASSSSGPAFAGAEADVSKKEKNLNKKGFSVRFRDLVKEEEGGGELLSVREFREDSCEKEVPFWVGAGEDDVHGRSTHDLDVSEGQALRKHDELEEQMEWYEPRPYHDLAARDPTPEALAQETRDRGILAPPLPPGPDVDESLVRTVQRGPETANLYTVGMQPAAPGLGIPAGQTQQPQKSVSELLKGLDPKLLGLGGAVSGGQPGFAQSSGGYGWAGDGYDQAHQPQHSYAYGAPAGGYGAPPQDGGAYDHRGGAGGYKQSGPLQPQQYAGGGGGYGNDPWGGQNNYQRNYDEPPRGGGGRGWGDRGGGGAGGGEGGGRRANPTPRNFRTRPCKFWMEGTCREGERCTFKHEYE